MRAALSSVETVPITGRRPTNSGISPNFNRSSGSTCDSSSSSLPSCARRISARKPMPCLPRRLCTILSRPAKAPPQMKRTLVVSIWMNS